MRLFQIIIFLTTTVMPSFFAAFQCSESKVKEECPQTNCRYLQSYQGKGLRICRCRTVIKDHPIVPKNELDYKDFYKTCYSFKNNLKELWIHDVGLEAIDKRIFEIYQNLRHLDLTYNNIKLPFTQQAINLTVLNISHNGLSGLSTDSVSNFASLRVLNASFNEIEKLETCFKGTKGIEEIYLNNNRLRYIQKDEFNELPFLRVLNLACNLLSVIESNLLQVVNLQELYLRNNSLMSINKSQFVNLPNLVVLDIGYNKFETLGDHYTFGKLKEFMLENNQLANVNANVLNRIKELDFLNVSNNRIGQIGHNTFSHQSHLTTLDMSSNSLRNISSDNFHSLHNLKQLYVSNNSLTEEVVSCDNMHNLRKLNVLDLSINQISKIYNCTFTQLEQLRWLSLAKNELEVILPNTFQSLTQLEDLNLAQNRLKKIPSGTLDSLTKLQKFNISHNNITDLNLELFRKNRQLREIDFSDNQLVEFDFDQLEDVLPFIKQINFDSLLCADATTNFSHFDSSVVAISKCRRRYQSVKVWLILGGVAAVGIFAIIGVYKVCCKCGSRNKTFIQLVPLSPR